MNGGGGKRSFFGGLVWKCGFGRVRDKGGFGVQ